MNIRRTSAWKAINEMKMVWRSSTSRERKLKFFCPTVEALLLYGSECWTMNATLQKSLGGSYTRMLRVVLNVDVDDYDDDDDVYRCYHWAFQLPVAHEVEPKACTRHLWLPLYGPCVISEQVEMRLLATTPALAYSYRRVCWFFQVSL